MFFLYDANLKLLKTIPSDVYQGSDGADDIYFLVPINPNAAINVAFLLPTGKTLTSRATTKQGEAVGLETPDGVSYAMWSITLTAQETAYAGNVTLQITVISGAMRMTSQKGVFPVLTGVPPVLPEAPQVDAYNDIRAAIAALQTAVYNTKAIGISTYSYNESKKNASIKSYVTSAMRVVVPDYVIKGDEYYIVTGIDPNVKPPTSVTEYEFGSNITSIGSGAFTETKIKSLEFPKTLTSIGASAFTDATTREFVFNGAVPTIGSFAFSGVNATAYVPAVYYDDYVTAFETYPGIVVQKKSETLADVIETADEAKAIALKAQSTASEVKTELNGKVDKSVIVQEKGTATDKVMSQKAVTDALGGKVDKIEKGLYWRVYAVDRITGANSFMEVSFEPKKDKIPVRDEYGRLKAEDAVYNKDVVNLGQLTMKLLDYLLKSGGIISGNLSIQGDLEVRGTTKTTEEETLNVKDSIVVTNSSGADLSSTLAGFVIRLNATDCYGIIYDASSESVKLGKGKITNGKFTFNSGEGNAVAVRADGSLMTNGHLVKWDATALKFVDAGKSISDITNALDNKLDKAERPNQGYSVYVIASSSYGTDPKTVPVKWEPEVNTLPGRTDKGTLRAQDAIIDDDLVTMRQFKAAINNFVEKSAVDQAYSATSENPQSGKAVAKAIEKTVVYTEVRNDTGKYPFSGTITAEQAKSIIKGNTQFCFRGYKIPSEPLSISLADYRMFSTYYEMPYNVDGSSPYSATLQAIYVGSNGKKLYMEQCALKRDGSYTVTDVAEDGWLLVKAFKTVFGKQIIENGNVTLYKHKVSFSGQSEGVTIENGYFEFLSVNNLVVASMDNLKTLLGNTFKQKVSCDCSYPVSGPVGFGDYITESVLGIIEYNNGLYRSTVPSNTGITFTDIVIEIEAQGA